MVDINVVVSALLFPSSVPNQALQKALQTSEILMSFPVWSELEDVMNRPKFNRYISAKDRKEFLQDFYHLITPFNKITEKFTDCRDSKDNKYLELAVCGKADYIITGDSDLLILSPFRSIAIVKPETFVTVVD